MCKKMMRINNNLVFKTKYNTAKQTMNNFIDKMKIHQEARAKAYTKLIINIDF